MIAALRTFDLAALLAPARLGAKQVLRLHRFGLAALTYALTAALVAIAWSFGVLPGRAAAEVAAAYLAINLALYFAIRSGFNLRFREPSLTTFQIVTAITVVMYLAYNMHGARYIALSGCFVVFLFGAFHLGARRFRVIILFTLAAYALVLDMLMYLRPEAIGDVRHAWLSWLVLAGLLPGFAIVGAALSTLRRRLRDSEERFRSLTRMSSDFYWESDTEHRLTQRGTVDHQPAGRGSIFRTAVGIGQRRWEAPYLSPDEPGWTAHRAVLDAREPFRDFEFSRLGIHGDERYVWLSGDPVFDALGAFIGYRGVGTDVTARRQAEQALRASAQELRVFADNIPAMTISWDEHLRCRFVNSAFADFFGVDAASSIGKDLRGLVGERIYLEIEAHFAEVVRGYPVTYQSAHKLQDLEIRLLPKVGEHGRVVGCYAVATDITKHKLTEKRIQRVAHHDSLTGLPNRLLFDDRLAQALSLARGNSRLVGLLYLDLDRFKPVNDKLGHAAGDEMLVAVAERIRRQVRESDTVARVGGDEFIVILPDIPRRAVADAVAGKVAVALAAPFLVGTPPQAIAIGASIGISVYPEDAEDADGLVKAADAAMYRAKQGAHGISHAI